MNHTPDHTSDHNLDDLLQRQQLWRAADGLAADRGTLTTGAAALDDELAGGGWPEDGLTEVIGDTRGLGEMRLLLPALARLSQQQTRWIAFIAPPWIPYAPALAAAGVDVSRVLLIRTRSHADQLWATEQALKTGTCSAVLSWPDARHLRHAELRRLQIAAREGGTWGLVFRPENTAREASPAELRVQVERDPSGYEARPQRLTLRLLKRRGGWPTQALEVPLEDALSRRLAGPEQTAALRQLALLRGAEKPAETAAPADGERASGKIVRLAERQQRDHARH